MTAHPQPPTLSEAEYLDMERAAGLKHEYYGGAIFAMGGASEAHNLIASNLNASLHGQLRGRGCRIYPSDMRLKVLQSGLYTYPDLTVVCGPPEFASPARRDTLVNPLVIVEILAPSTERYDRGEKFQHYRSIPSLQEYLLVAQDRPQIEQYVRQAEGLWLLIEASGMAASLALPSLGCVLRLAEVYEQVELPARPPFLPHEPSEDRDAVAPAAWRSPRLNRSDAAAPPAALSAAAEPLSAEQQEQLLPAAIKLIQHHSRASASLLQRRLRIGYNKAAQLIELLEQQGYVGPPQEGRSRPVLKRAE